MTAQEVVEALCEAAGRAADEWSEPEVRDEARAHRDAIKAALVAVLIASDVPCGDATCSGPACDAWRKLEEACRG